MRWRCAQASRRRRPRVSCAQRQQLELRIFHLQPLLCFQAQVISKTQLMIKVPAPQQTSACMPELDTIPKAIMATGRLQTSEHDLTETFLCISATASMN